MECLKPKFFQLGLKTQNPECVLHTKHGLSELAFNLPKDKHLEFKYDLKSCKPEADNEDEHDGGISLEECIFLEQQRNNHLACKVNE